jgi:FdrA protein
MFMGTPSNQLLLEQIGLSSAEAKKATANDLIIILVADDDSEIDSAIKDAKEMLIARRQAVEASGEFRPRTLDSALRSLPNANLAAISVPGAYAKFEAVRALKRGLHVFLFSDNVPLGEEIELKQEAINRQLFCMGPDQGTAYFNGTGLGFANIVSKGRIGCVSASGTGLQAVVSRLDALGEGISHGIGVGGRDLSEKVGGMMTIFALESLKRDPSTDVIVIVSKPPHPSVMSRLEERIKDIQKPIVVCCIGMSDFTIDGATIVKTLDEAAEAGAAALHGKQWQSKVFSDPALVRNRIDLIRRNNLNSKVNNGILGLYTGGTLAYESKILLEGLLGPVRFNPEQPDSDSFLQILDLGEDIYTVGRPHPMIDPLKRTELILETENMRNVGVLLLDLVLGKGSHENPADPLTASVQLLRERIEKFDRKFVAAASVVGTEQDPQGLNQQVEQLEAAGIHVFPSNAEAARFAALLVKPELDGQLLGE